MRPSPAEEYQRLARTYAEMSDGELINLAATFSDLTELAQPILRDEMKRRNLGDPSAPSPAAPAVVKELQRPAFGSWKSGIANRNEELDPEFNNSGEGASEDDPNDSDSTLPVEFTWKTLLCEADSREHAWQIAEVLKTSGIESWTTGPSSYFGSQTIKIMVAADQLDEARALIAKPIPQDIIDQSKEKPEDFVPPTCPKCGAEDPLLESVDPTNTWLCENCGAHWTDSTAFHEAATENPR
jgi:hypothetical protein